MILRVIHTYYFHFVHPETLQMISSALMCWCFRSYYWWTQKQL